MRAALYLRVSTVKKVKGESHIAQAEREQRYQQDTDRQERELREVAQRLGHEVVAVYCDRLSGAKGREQRPDFDRLHRDAV
jgi:DNA invertase Pin-like site-specific DNA recombinase